MDANARPPHSLMFPATVSDRAREAYWADVKLYLESTARPRLRRVYERQVRPALIDQLGREPDRHEIAAAMMEVDENRWWYLLRTQSQWRAFDATRAIVERQLPQLQERAAALGNGPSSLELNPDLEIPAYLQAEAHCMDGGYTGEGGADALAVGATYDRGMTLHRMGTQGWLCDDVGHSLAAWIKENFPNFSPRRILELGCTVGHTLLPFKQAFPEAEVFGVDVAGPVLVYGRARAAALGVDAHFSQQNAESTSFEAGSFDLVFSRILLHETGEGAVPAIFAECHRLLRPGGLMFHSDAPQFDQLDPYTASLRHWDIAFNHEPYMSDYYAMPLEDMFDTAGFAPDAMFRAFAPSLRLAAGGIRGEETRSGGRYFLAGAWR